MIANRQLFRIPRMSRTYSTHLQNFIVSNDNFRVLNFSSRPPNGNGLYILDASFNPPTNAHLGLVLSSLPKASATVLLILAIQNADKKAKPASFDHRLEMMELLAKNVEANSNATALLALTKHARFVDKANEVSISFPWCDQVMWLVGYDTL